MKVAQVEIGMILVDCCMTYRFAIMDLEAFDATMLRMIFMTQYCDDHVGEIIMNGKHKLFAFKSKKVDLLARFDPAWGLIPGPTLLVLRQPAPHPAVVDFDQNDAVCYRMLVCGSHLAV